MRATGHVVLPLRVRVADVLAALGRRLWGHAGGKENVAMSVVHTVNDYARARQALKDLRILEDNWDGEGAPRPSKGAIDRAESVVQALQHDLIVPAPRVAGMPDGGIQLSWRRITQAGRLDIEARLQDQGDELMIGYAHVPGFEFHDQVHGAYEIADRVRASFKSPA